MFNHSSNNDLKDFINTYKKFTAKQYIFLVIDCTLSSENPLRLRNNILERILKLILTIDNDIEMKNYIMILTEKQQKYQHCHQVTLINVNVLQWKKYYLLNKVEL